MDEGVGEQRLGAAIDEVIVEACALVTALGTTGGPRERRIAAQLTVALVALASARGQLSADKESDVASALRPARGHDPSGVPSL